MSSRIQKAVQAAREDSKTFQVTLKEVVDRMSALTNQTMMIYLWKWYPDAHGKTGKELTGFLKERGGDYTIADQYTEKISGISTVVYVFINKKEGILKFAKLEFSVTNTNKNFKDENLTLVFGHQEIEQPANFAVFQG